MPKSHNYLAKYTGKNVDTSLALSIARDFVKQAQSPSRKVKVRKFEQEHLPALKEFVLDTFRRQEGLRLLAPEYLLGNDHEKVVVLERRAEFSLREYKHGYTYDGDTAVIYVLRKYRIHRSNSGITVFCDVSETIGDIFLTR